MTITIMLGLLVVPYLILGGVGRLSRRLETAVALRGRIGLALVFLFTSIGHFVKTAPMVGMLPAWVPYRTEIVHATGVLEFAAVVGLLVPFPGVVRLTGICLILFLVAVFPANVYSAFARSGLGSHAIGPWYLLIRAPLQLLLIGWTWWFAIRSQKPVQPGTEGAGG